jgi:ELWxxDGT repeat protein
MPVRVTDIAPGAASSFPFELTNVNGTLYFTAISSNNGSELWRISPNTGLPVLIEIEPGPGSSNPANFTALNGTLYFTAFNSTTGRALWKIDPATGNPVRIEIQPGITTNEPGALKAANDTLYFSAYTSDTGRELWKLDPDTGKPVLAQEFNPGSGSSDPVILGYENGKLYLVANNGINGPELWAIAPSNPDSISPASPTISSVIDDVDAIQGEIASGNRTNDTTPTFVITLNGAGDTAPVVGDIIRLFNGSTQISSYTLTSADIAAGTASITPSALTEGNYSIRPLSSFRPQRGQQSRRGTS